MFSWPFNKKKPNLLNNTINPDPKFIEAGLFIKCSNFDDAVGKEIIYIDEHAGSIRFLLSDHTIIKFNFLNKDPEYITKFEFDEVLYFSKVISGFQFKKNKQQTEAKWIELYVKIEKDILKDLQEKYN